MKIKKGDTIQIMVGRDKGKQGKVERTYVRSGKVLVENLNMFKKNVKKTEQTPQGGIIDIPRPLEASNALVVCPKCKKPTRLGYRIEEGKKNRVCKSCDKTL